MIYDKLRDKTLVGKSLVVNSMGGLQILGFHTTDNNELILVYDVYVLKNLLEYVASKNEFADTFLRESLQRAVLSSQDDNNPILIIIKLKPTK